jgi:sporulation-control protein spo0M
MTIGKTVEIPANRHLHLDFDFDIPVEIPVGRAQVELKVISFVDKQKKSALKNTDNSLTPHTDALLKILSNLGDVNIDEIREERLAKHL